MANSLTVMPWVFPQWLTNNADPAASYRLFTYAAGTSTKLATYTDAAGTVAQSNPLTVNSAGRPASLVFLQAKSYKFVFAPPGTDDPPNSPLWTADNVSANSAFSADIDVTGTAGETLVVDEWVYLSAGDGGLSAGRWYKTDADLDYASTAARMVGIVTAGGAVGGDIAVRRLGRVEGLSGLTTGSLYYLSATAGEITSSAPTNPRRVGQADSTTSLVIGAEIVEPNKGFIPLDLSVGRILSGGATQNAAANGGLTASDSAPIYQRVNGATDQALRLNWAAGVTSAVTWSFPYPPDLDADQNLTVHILAAMSGATNTPTMGIAYFEGVGDADAGGNTAAITGTTVAEYTVTIVAANLGTQPNFAAVTLTPGTHATDAVFLYALWAEYVEKLKST